MRDKEMRNLDENNNTNNNYGDLNSKANKNLLDDSLRISQFFKDIIEKSQVEEMPPSTISNLSNVKFSERKVFDEYIFPLLTTLYYLSSTSANLSTSVDILSKTYTKHPDSSELKNTVHLIYNINEECEDVFHILKKRINKFLKFEKDESS